MAAMETPFESSVFLPDIRSAYNIGSIFRTCDAAAVARVYLAGHSPCPTDRFGRARKDIAKTALGAEKTVLWEYKKNPKLLLARLKKEGWHIVAVEQAPGKVDYRKFKINKKKIVFMFGNEVGGVSKSLLSLADSVIDIPMAGEKESLNVSVAAGVILFHFKQR